MVKLKETNPEARVVDKPHLETSMKETLGPEIVVDKEGLILSPGRVDVRLPYSIYG